MMKKKIFVIISLIMGVLSFPATTMAASLAINPPSGTLNKGCEYSVTVELDTQNAPTDGTDVILQYESSKLAITTTGITNGKIYGDYPGNSVDQTAGRISISGIASVSDAYTGKGTFATLKFRVVDTAAGSTTLKFDFDPTNKTKTTDSNVVERGAEISDVLSLVTDGVFTIGTGTCGAIGNTTNGRGQLEASGLPMGSSLPINPPVASASSLPVYNELPKSGILDNTILVASVGMLLVILGVVGLAAL